VRDARSDVATSWTDLAGTFGEGLILSEMGEFRGNVGGCAVFGEASGPASHAISLNLSGCADGGSYVGIINLPANDNDTPTLLVVGNDRGWRLQR